MIEFLGQKVERTTQYWPTAMCIQDHYGSKETENKEPTAKHHDKMELLSK